MRPRTPVKRGQAVQRAIDPHRLGQGRGEQGVVGLEAAGQLQFDGAAHAGGQRIQVLPACMGHGAQQADGIPALPHEPQPQAACGGDPAQRIRGLRSSSVEANAGAPAGSSSANNRSLAAR